MNAPGNPAFQQLHAFYRLLVPTLTEESWERCEKALHVRTLKKGALLQRDGVVCNNVSFINSGLVRMYYNHNGKEKVVCFFNENNYTSDYHSFLTPCPATLTIQAMEPTEVVETSYNDLQALYRDVPEANLLGRMICEQLFIRVNEGNASMITQSLEERYRELISKQPWLVQRVPQYMIASMLGITPEALSRVKARMNRTRRVPGIPLAIGHR